MKWFLVSLMIDKNCAIYLFQNKSSRHLFHFKALNAWNKCQSLSLDKIFSTWVLYSCCSWWRTFGHIYIKLTLPILLLHKNDLLKAVNNSMIVSWMTSYWFHHSYNSLISTVGLKFICLTKFYSQWEEKSIVEFNTPKSQYISSLKISSPYASIRMFRNHTDSSDYLSLLGLSVTCEI